MKAMKKCGAITTIAGLLLALSGCSTNAGWNYVPSPARVASKQAPVSLAVAHFQDQRGSENSYYRWLCAFPLVPYCTSTYDRPDAANGFLTVAAYSFRPTDDLAEAAALELRQTGMFRDVFVTDKTVDPGAPLMLHGTIQSTKWNGATYTYLLGPYGPLLWLFGLPIGSATNALALHLELADVASGRVLWTQDISQNYSITETYYSNFNKDFGYPTMFRDGMAPAVTSLESWVASQPQDYWTKLQPAATTPPAATPVPAAAPAPARHPE
ncbi:MAG TPA: hypothetical protein VEC38_10045 [Candidatus Binataceae bacterium]|nr:hypothetical protein [Candidatus Binataceae bacterium]